MTKIFIVEDTVAIREQLESFLTSYGYEVVATTQFDQIIDHIEREEPQLVLLDINLPIVDGYHVCRELRKQSNIPIIVVTSRDTEMDELMSINLGADDFVTKPLDNISFQVEKGEFVGIMGPSGIHASFQTALILLTMHCL